MYESKFFQGFRDIGNFFRFKREMNALYKLRDSKFNKFNLHINRFGNILYTQINCSDTDFMNAGYDYEKMLKIKLQPIIDYLSEELNWGDYLRLQLQNFVDEETGEPSLSYGILFIYTGYSMTMSKAFWLGLFGILAIAGGVTALCLVL
jgi:hypothetical protein